jgi:hypothetical protein
MDTNDETKRTWETPEIMDLDVNKTDSGGAESVAETQYVFPIS